MSSSFPFKDVLAECGKDVMKTERELALSQNLTINPSCLEKYIQKLCRDLILNSTE